MHVRDWPLAFGLCVDICACLLLTVCMCVYVCACEGGGGRRASAGKQEWCTAEEVESAIEESQMEGGSEEELAYPLAEKGGKEESDTQQEFLGDKLQYPQTFWGESEEEEETR